MVHNRTPDDEYRKDVEEARRLLALYESMHNGKIREERGEVWYGSREMLDWDRAVTGDMGILLGRVMDYADAVRAERDHYLQAAYKPADPPPSATADVGAIQRNRARVQSLLFIWRGDAVMLADGATVEETRALAWMPHDIDTLLAALAQAEAQRDKAVAALKRIEEMAIAAMGEWMSSVELIPASLPELQVYWDIAKAAADALAQQEGSDGE